MNLWMYLVGTFFVLQLLIYEAHSLDDSSTSSEPFFTHLWPKWRTAPRTTIGRHKANNAKFENATFKRVKSEETDQHMENDVKPIGKVKIESADDQFSCKRNALTVPLNPIKTEPNEDDPRTLKTKWNKVLQNLAIKEEPCDSGDANRNDDYNEYDDANDNDDEKEQDDDDDDNNNTSSDSYEQLDKSDEEIYKKLKEYKQIKRSNPKLSDTIISKRHFGVNQKTLYRWKTKYGCEKRHHCHDEIVKIMKLYKRSIERNAKFTDEEFADKFGVSISTLNKWKNKRGIEKVDPLYNEKKKQKLLKKYGKIKVKAPRISDARIAEQLGINGQTLRKWKNKYGYKQNMKIVYSPQEKYNAIQQYKKALIEHGDAAPRDYELANKFKISRGTLLRWKTEFGLKSRKGYGEEEKMEILQKYYKLKKQKGEQSESSIAEQLAISRHTLKRWKLEFGKRKLKSEKSSVVQEKAAHVTHDDDDDDDDDDESIFDEEEH